MSISAKCRQRAGNAIGRSLTDQETQELDRMMRRSVRYLKKNDAEFAKLPREAALMMAAEHAAQDYRDQLDLEAMAIEGVMPEVPTNDGGDTLSQTWNGPRKSGFHDDLERGTEPFHDDRLGPVGSNWNKAVEMARNGYSVDEIAEETGYTHGSVDVKLSQARALGIFIPRSESGSKKIASTLRMRELFDAGRTNRQIADRLQKSIINVKQRRMKYNRERAAQGLPPISSTGTPYDDDSLSQSRLMTAMEMDAEELDFWYNENVNEIEEEGALAGMTSFTLRPANRDDGNIAIMIDYDNDTDSIKVDMTLNGRFSGDEGGKTKGNAQAEAIRTFDFTMKAVRAWVALNKPEIVHFAGSTDAHDRFYQKMLARFEGDGYDAYRVERTIRTLAVAEDDMVNVAETLASASKQFILIPRGGNIEEYSTWFQEDKEEYRRNGYRSVRLFGARAQALGRGRGPAGRLSASGEFTATALNPAAQERNADAPLSDRSDAPLNAALQTGDSLSQSSGRSETFAARQEQKAQALGFTITAFRGLRLPMANSNTPDSKLVGAGWFTDDPDIANTYSGNGGMGLLRPIGMKVRLRLRKPLRVDAKGKSFAQIPLDDLPADVKKQVAGNWLASTEVIATAARKLGYDGVIFENVIDDIRGNGGKPSTVYNVFSTRNVRSFFAAYREDNGDMLSQSGAPMFYSALHRFISRHSQKSAPASQWKAMIANAPGIKPEEVEWTGVNEWLDAQTGNVTRDDLAAFVEANGFSLFQRSKDPPGWGSIAPPPELPPMSLDLQAVREAYPDRAEEIVQSLPRAIVERSVSASGLDTMMEIIRGVKATLKKKPPRSLHTWIKAKRRSFGKATVSQPGIKGINGIKGSAGELKAMGLDGLINEKSGTDIDYAREAAVEDGYLPDDATINDFLDAIRREAGGDAVYSTQDSYEAREYEAAKQWEEFLLEGGVDLSSREPELRKQVSVFVNERGDAAMHPDYVAEQFGFETGEELLSVLARIGDREKHITERVKARLAAEYGDVMNDGALMAEADEFARKEITSRQTEVELEALARSVGEAGSSRLAKQIAAQRIRTMTVDQVMKYGRFLNAERRAMQDALEATRKGDLVRAFEAKRRQVINQHLHNEAKKLAETLEKQRATLIDLIDNKNKRKGIAPDWMANIDALLEGYELRRSKQSKAKKASEGRASLAAFVAKMKEDEREGELSEQLIALSEQADQKAWDTLTVEQAGYLVDAAKNMMHMGRAEQKFMTDLDKRRFATVIEELEATLQAVKALPGAQREYSTQKTGLEATTSFLREAHAWQMRIEHEIIALDGKPNGPLWKAIWRPLTEAASDEARMSRVSSEEVKAAYEIYTGAERRAMLHTAITLPELGPSRGKRWTKAQVISMALNWGNQYNRDALLAGYEWTPEQMEAVFARLMTDKDWSFVEAVWAASSRWKEESFALEKAMTGVEPKAVEPMKFTTAQGREMAGGYYHIDYDTNVLGAKGRRQKKQETKEALKDQVQSYSRPRTNAGSLIARKGSDGKKVRLELSVFERSIMETIHDIAYRKALHDISRIIRNDRFADAFEQVAGPEMYNQLEPWLKAIAKPPMEVLAPHLRMFASFRRNFPVMVMGYKFKSAIIQLSGLIPSAVELGPHRVAGAVVRAFTNGPGSVVTTWKEIAEKSEFMRDRIRGYDRDIREVSAQMGAQTPLGTIRRNSFVLLSAVDMSVSVPTWLAAYDKAMDGKVKSIEKGNEEDAIAYADSLVRRTQTAGLVQDLPRVMRDTELMKQFTTLYGYFSNLYGYTTQKVLDVRRGNISKAEFVYFAAMMFVLMPILTELLAGRLAPDDEDDDETMAGNAGRAILSNVAGMVPIVRDLAAYNLKPEYGYKMSPVAGTAKDVATATAALKDGEVTEAETKAAIRAVSGFAGLPSSQIIITGDYVKDALAGDEDPLADPADTINEALLEDTR